MSLLSRISGVLDSFHTIDLEEKDRYGAGGEDEVEEIIRGGQWRYVRNPLAPHPSKPGVFLESDFLVQVSDGLFAVEVKKLIGRVEYDDDDHRYTRQVKQGRYGEGVFVKRLSNPLQKTNGFAGRLKSYLVQVDTRFQRLYRRRRGFRADSRHLRYPRPGRAHLHDRTQGVEGSGLGLAPVNRVAAAHGGQLEVRSRPGEGTVVAMRLPLVGV